MDSVLPTAAETATTTKTRDAIRGLLSSRYAASRASNISRRDT
jgi:hypothetical protein